MERNAPGVLIRSHLQYEQNGNPATITDSSFTNDGLSEIRKYHFFYTKAHKIDYVTTTAYNSLGERTLFEQKNFQWEDNVLTAIHHSNEDIEYFSYNAQGKITEILRTAKNSGPYWRETYVYNQQGNYTEQRSYQVTKGVARLFSVVNYGDFDQKRNAYSLIPYYQHLVSIPAQQNNAQTLHHALDFDQDGLLEEDESVTSTFKFLYDTQGLPTSWQQLDQNYTHTFAAKYQAN